MEARLDRIIAELAERYGVSARFLERIRPIAAKIFHPETPDDARPALLTTLAETCARQAETERNCARAMAGIESFFTSLAEMLRQALESGPATGSGPAAPAD